MPCYVQDDPSLAGVLTESPDRCAEKLGGKTVRDVLPEHLVDVPPVDGDDTIMEVAAIMARRRSPLVAVINEGYLRGVITATRLLTAAVAALTNGDLARMADAGGHRCFRRHLG